MLAVRHVADLQISDSLPRATGGVRSSVLLPSRMLKNTLHVLQESFGNHEATGCGQVLQSQASDCEGLKPVILQPHFYFSRPVFSAQATPSWWASVVWEERAWPEWLRTWRRFLPANRPQVLMPAPWVLERFPNPEKTETRSDHISMSSPVNCNIKHHAPSPGIPMDLVQSP